MPVFGKSLFETVLDGLPVQHEEGEEFAPPRRANGMSAAFLSGIASAEPSDRGDFADLYSDFGESPPPFPVDGPPDPPSWLERLSSEEIARDLDLSNCSTDADFRERRRAFARANHPDTVHPDFRGQATIRMTTANRLIDDAIDRLGRQG